jgi:serine/threonine protein phosphatase PrpC
MGEMVAYYYTHREEYPKYLSETIFQLIKTAFNHQNATYYGSQDNISMALIPILMEQPSVIILLFDGHGGDSVSKGLGRDFYPCFMEKMGAPPSPRKRG